MHRGSLVTLAAAAVVMQRSREPAWQRMLTADGGFPRKVAMPDGSVLLEVVKIEKQKLASALFSVPLTSMKMGR